MPGHRTPDNGNAYDFFSIGQPNRKLVSYDRLMMAVILLDIGVCLF